MQQDDSAPVCQKSHGEDCGCFGDGASGNVAVAARQPSYGRVVQQIVAVAIGAQAARQGAGLAPETQDHYRQIEARGRTEDGACGAEQSHPEPCNPTRVKPQRSTR